MTRGITQADVFAAADLLLAAGERPTVERIRATLGSGSPNTVIRHLDAWWADAGHRLKAKADLPEVPPAIAELAAALWAHAVDGATQHAEAAMAHARAELDAEHQRLDAEKMVQAAENQRLAAMLTQAEQAAVAHAAQLDAWNARSRDWESERERMLAEAARLVALADQDRAALDALRDQYVSLQQQGERERTAVADHIRSVEDRSHTNVDAARQEAKLLRQQLTTQQREASRHEATLARERALHAKAIAKADRELATAQAKADTLASALAVFKNGLRRAPTKKAAVRATSTSRRQTPKA